MPSDPLGSICNAAVLLRGAHQRGCAVTLREIPFGTPIDDPDGYCIYTTGHVDAMDFLEAVKTMTGCDTPPESRAELALEDVEHIRFRRMRNGVLASGGKLWRKSRMQTEEFELLLSQAEAWALQRQKAEAMRESGESIPERDGVLVTLTERVQ